MMMVMLPPDTDEHYPNRAARRAAKRERLRGQQAAGLPLSAGDKRYLALLDAREQRERQQRDLDERNRRQREGRRFRVDSIDRLNVSQQAADDAYVGQTVERDYDEDGNPVLYDEAGMPRLRAGFTGYLDTEFDAALRWLRAQEEFSRHYQALIWHVEHEIPLREIARRYGVALATAHNYVGHARALIRGYMEGQKQERERRRR